MPIDPKQYDSAVNFIRDDAEWSRLVNNISNKDDQLRCKAYELYEDMYNNRPEHIRVVLRGEDDDSVEIYLPSAKKNIEAINRFLAVDFDFQVDPDTGNGALQDLAEQTFQNLFDKQKLKVKIGNVKRYMLMKGDALLHIQAFSHLRPGERVCIEELKPEHYFPIENLVTGRLEGCHIVDVIRNPKNSVGTKSISDDWIVRRQTYKYRMDDDGHPKEDESGAIIVSELSLWQLNMWDDRLPDNEVKLIEVVEKERLLPPEIKQLPVFHFANRRPPNSSFGMSELAGMETLIDAMNQSASDEDLTLVTQGLGVYWTDASPPVDDDGNEVEWEIGPGSVVRISQGGNFGRVTGVSSVAPFHDHIKMLDEFGQQAAGVPDVAIGMVDVQQVESGIALQLKFGPLLSKCKEIELVFKPDVDAFLDDLKNWIKVYEGIDIREALVTASFGDPMPRNKAEELKNVLDIWTQCPSALPISWLYEQLNDIMGYDLDDTTDFAAALEDAKKIAENSMPVDPFGSQMGNQMDQFGTAGDLNGQPPPGNAPLNGASKGTFQFGSR